jgi:hypothetical protein
MNGPLGPDGLHTKVLGQPTSISIQYNQSAEHDHLTLVDSGPGSLSSSVAITYLSQSLQIQGLATSKQPSVPIFKNRFSGDKPDCCPSVCKSLRASTIQGRVNCFIPGQSSISSQSEA